MEPETVHHAIPSQWNENPSEQLRALRDEVLKQKDFPTSTTAAFMAKACDAIDRLPPDWFPRERTETLALISQFFYLDGQFQLAIESAAKAVVAAVRGKHEDLEIVARARHGNALKTNFDFSGSTREIVHAMEIARRKGAAEWEARLLNSLGTIYNDLGLQGEAIRLFERSASFFESRGDHVSASVALNNAALAALRRGDVDQGVVFAERGTRSWSHEPRNAHERLWAVQGALTHCQLLIQAGCIDEAVEQARRARAVAEASGIATAKSNAAIAETISSFAAGTANREALERMVDAEEVGGGSPYLITLNAAIRTYEATGHFDDAVTMQLRLLEFTRRQKAEEVRRLVGEGPSQEEIEGVARLARFGREIQKQISGLVDIAINQSLRAGYDHARVFRLGRLTELFTSSLGWSSKRTEQIALAAKLLDIGTIAIPSELLTKRRDLSDAERRIVDEHAKFGADLLAQARLELLQACVPIVRHRHERWDGGGPEGLAGADIPTEARVVALCDSFESLTHERPWRFSQSPQAALQTIEMDAGTHFDPQLAHRFIDWLRNELAKASDFIDLLDAEAFDNEYIKVRQRLNQLIRENA